MVHGRDARARCVKLVKNGNTVNVVFRGERKRENERIHKFGVVKDDRANFGGK